MVIISSQSTRFFFVPLVPTAGHRTRTPRPALSHVTSSEKQMPLVLGVDALAGTTERDLVREVASRPTDPTVLYNFAATLERSGKDSLAAVVYMRALDFETEGSEEWAETIAAMCDAARTLTALRRRPAHSRLACALWQPALRPRAASRRRLATHTDARLAWQILQADPAPVRRRTKACLVGRRETPEPLATWGRCVDNHPGVAG
jgi:hypothetical protein